MNTFGHDVINYYKHLTKPPHLTSGVELLYPFDSDQVMSIVDGFYKQFYDDHNPRTFLIGINPGRFGAGTTGIPFTDPIRLKDVLGIDHDLTPKPELSSKFIYNMIAEIGGPVTFYQNFYFTSVSPLGFIKEGKNLNYYDIPELQTALESYMVGELKKQIAFGAKPIAYSLGMGKNIAYLHKINREHKLFEEIRPLPHPRWVMQYRLKRLEEFLTLYTKELRTNFK